MTGFLANAWENVVQTASYLLAYHYGLSRNRHKQRHYFAQAAAAAQASYANDVAIDYYRRLLPLLPQAEQSGVRLKLGEVRQLIGEWGEAERDYQAALRLAQTHRQPGTSQPGHSGSAC